MVEEIIREFEALPEVEAIALGGSRVGNNYDEKSDFDVYIYVKSPISEKIRTDILSKYCERMENGNHFWEYEDNFTLNNGIDIDVLYRNLDDFLVGITEVVEQYQAHNGYTTCMWHNLRTCKVIFDKEQRLEAAKIRFDIEYPKQLKTNIINHNMKLVRTAPFYRCNGDIRRMSEHGLSADEETLHPR